MPDLRIGDGLQPRRHSAGSPGREQLHAVSGIDVRKLASIESYDARVDTRRSD